MCLKIFTLAEIAGKSNGVGLHGYQSATPTQVQAPTAINLDFKGAFGITVAVFAGAIPTIGHTVSSTQIVCTARSHNKVSPQGKYGIIVLRVCGGFKILPCTAEITSSVGILKTHHTVTVHPTFSKILTPIGETKLQGHMFITVIA